MLTSRRLGTTVALLLISAAAWVLAAPARSEVLRRVGAFPYGPSTAVAVDPDRPLVYLSSGGAVLVLDVREPEDPRPLSAAVQTRGNVFDLDYDPVEHRLYVAAGEGGLEIWDLADPARPRRLSTTEVLYFGAETPVEEVDYQDGFAYVATGWGYVHWLDVADPAQPVDRGFNGLGGNPTDTIFVDGPLAYSCGPRFQQYVVLPDGGLSGGGYRELGCGTLAIDGGVGYVSAGGGTLYALDLTSPFFPTLSNLPLGSISRITKDGDLLYVSGGGELHIVDATDPGNLAELGTYTSPGGAAGVAVSGVDAYLAAGSSGVRVVDVRDPTAPFEVGGLDTLGATASVFLDGRVAYLSMWEAGVTIVDLSQPTKTRLLGRFDTAAYANETVVRDGRMYVADDTGGLRIADVSDPAAPVELGAYTGSSVYHVDVAGSLALAASYQGTVSVLDVGDPAAPKLLGSLTLADPVWRVRLVGSYGYVANMEGGMKVLDLSDPTTPRVIGQLALPTVLDLAIQGDQAYIASADWSGGFVVADISNPAAPREISRYNPGGWFHPFDVAVSGRLAYAGAPAGVPDVVAFDVSNPASPVMLESITPPGDLFGLVAAGRALLIADGSAGLQIWGNTTP